ncbi:hypothetical protein DOLIC_00114 [Dolichomitus sp. PSUC_FEM 10030005]|nr:hypothetical protein [Dolichomitus sp. PSUC_FEM 10030005]
MDRRLQSRLKLIRPGDGGSSRKINTSAAGTSLYSRLMATAQMRNGDANVTPRQRRGRGGKFTTMPITTTTTTTQSNDNQCDHIYLDPNTPQDVLTHLESGISNIGGNRDIIDYNNTDNDDDVDDDDDDCVPKNDNCGALQSTNTTITNDNGINSGTSVTDKSIVNGSSVTNGNVCEQFMEIDDSWMYEDHLEFSTTTNATTTTTHYQEKRDNEVVGDGGDSVVMSTCKKYIFESGTDIDDDFRQLLNTEANVCVRISKIVNCAIDNLRHGETSSDILSAIDKSESIFTRCPYIHQLIDVNIFKKNMAKKKKYNANNVAHLFFSLNKMNNSRATISVDFTQFSEDPMERRAYGLLIATLFVIDNSNLRKIKNIDLFYAPSVSDDDNMDEYAPMPPLDFVSASNDSTNSLSFISTNCHDLYNFLISGHSYLHVFILRYAFISFVAS